MRDRLIGRSIRRALTQILILQLALPGFSASEAIPTRIASRGSTGLVGEQLKAGIQGQVGNDGAFRTSVELSLPAGPAGFQPSLAFEYSSSDRKPSWVGAGWSLDTGSIARSLREGVPSYDDLLDEFIYRGEKLVEVPIGSGEFHTEHESFLRIRRVVWSSGLDRWVLDPVGNTWEVTEKNGIATLFGVDAESRVDAAGGTYQWLAAQIVDLHDNGIQINYDRRDPGIAYPSSVRYGLRREGNTLASLDPANPDTVDRVVSFVLGPNNRPDGSLLFTAGLEQRMNHRLEQIDVSVAGGLWRRYVLEFQSSADSGRSLLTKVMEYGVDADQPSPTAPRVTSFSYRLNDTAEKQGWEQAANWAIPSGIFFSGTNGASSIGTRFADMNGDGLQDLVRKVTHYPDGDFTTQGGPLQVRPTSGVFLNTGTGFETSSTPELMPPVPTLHEHITLPNARIAPAAVSILIDVNRDGRADAIRADNWSNLSTGDVWKATSAYFEYWENGVSGWLQRQKVVEIDDGYEFPNGSFPDGGNSTAGDVVGFANSGLAGYSLIDHNTVKNPEACAADRYQPAVSFGRTVIAELNGDGRPDLLTKHRQISYDHGSPIYPLITLGDEVERSYALAAPDGTGYEAPLTDRYFVCNENTAVCDRESLIGQLAYARIGCGAGQLLHGAMGKRLFDVNGDGLSDQVMSYNDIYVNAPNPPEILDLHQHVYLNDGNDFLRDDNWNIPVAFESDGSFDYALLQQGHQPPPSLYHIDFGVRIMDLNGDGFLDLVRADLAQTGLGANNEGPFSEAYLGTGNPNAPWVASANWEIPATMFFTESEIPFNVPNARGVHSMDMGVRAIDLDGDGMPDLLKHFDGEPGEVWINKGDVPDLLETVTNPLSGTVSVTYTPSTDFDNTRADGHPGLPQILQVVKGISRQADSWVAPSTTSFEYAGGLWDHTERQFMGFREVQETHDGDPIRRVTTNYHQEPARLGLVEEISIDEFDGTSFDFILMQRTQHGYTTNSSPPYVALLAETIESEFDGNTNLGLPEGRSARTEFFYDGDLAGEGPFTYGNLTARVEYGEHEAGADVNPLDTRTFETDYVVPNVDAYLVALAKETRLRAGSAIGTGEIYRTNQFFYDGDLSGATPPIKGDLTRTAGVLDKANFPGDSDRIATFTYDDFGNVQTEISPRANAGEISPAAGTTTFTYDGLLNTFLTSVVNGLGHETSFAYEPISSVCSGESLLLSGGIGLVHAEQGPNDPTLGDGNLTCYDAFGRKVLERASGDLAQARWTYDDNPALSRPIVEFARTTVGGAERTLTTWRDGFGRAVGHLGSGTDHGGLTTDGRELDLAGRVSRTRETVYDNGGTRWTEFDYDSMNRVVEARFPGPSGNRMTATSYNRGTITSTDANSNTTIRHVDPFGRVIEVIEDDGSSADRTSYEYNVAGDLTSVTDRFGNQTTITYDDLGQRRTINDPDTGMTVYDHYDADGNLTQESQFGHGGSPIVVDSQFDALGRVLSRVVGADSVVWSYDSVGNGVGLLANRTDSSVEFFVDQYDRLGRVTRERRILDGYEFVFDSTYDPLSQLKTRTYPTGRVVEWEYDSGGYLTGIRSQSGSYYVSEVEWEADGRSRQWILGNGSRVEFDYDTGVPGVDAGTGRLEAINLWDGNQAPEVSLESRVYAFDPGDRIDTISGSAGSFSFDYDGLNRLIQATGPYGAGGAAATLQYAYDQVGNLTCRGASDRLQCGATGGTEMVYPSSSGSPRPHAPVTVDGAVATYGERGALLQLEGRQYAYDDLGRLTEVRQDGGLVSEYRYDSLGNRRRTIRHTQSLAKPDYFVGSDFEWDSATGIARIHLELSGTRVATQSEPLSPGQTAVAAPAAVSNRSWGLAAAGLPVALAALLLAIQLVHLRKRFSLPIWEPALAGTLGILVYLLLVTPVLAHIPDGDLNADQILDSADVLLSSRIATGDLAANMRQAESGDVAPLETAPDDLLGVADTLLIMRAVAADDVDGDGVQTSDELENGASPFRSDTDGDGLSDFDEIFIHGSDPSHADTDGDGILDGVDASPLAGVIYRHTDNLGSTTTQLDSNADVVSQIVFKPFGGSVDGQASSGDIGFGFTGQRFEANVGIYDYKARWYDARLGRFLSPDSLVATPFDPQNLNRYSYVLNNPLNLVDPTGNVTMFPSSGPGSRQFSSFGLSARPTLARFGQIAPPTSGFGSPDAFGEGLRSFISQRFGILDTLGFGFPSTVLGGFASAGLQDLNSLADGVATFASGFGLFGPKGAPCRFTNCNGIAPIAGPARIAFATKAIGGAAPVRLGQAGERAVRGIADIGPKVPIRINGRGRIPDGLTDTVLSEVKNVKSLSFTRQLRDFSDFSQKTGRRFDLFVRPKTGLSGPLQEAIDQRLVNIRLIPK